MGASLEGRRTCEASDGDGCLCQPIVWWGQGGGRQIFSQGKHLRSDCRQPSCQKPPRSISADGVHSCQGSHLAFQVDLTSSKTPNLLGDAIQIQTLSSVGKHQAKPKSKILGAFGDVHHAGLEILSETRLAQALLRFQVFSLSLMERKLPGDKRSLITIKIPKGKGAKENINLNAVGRGESPRGKHLGKGKWHVRVSMVFVDEPLQEMGTGAGGGRCSARGGLQGRTPSETGAIQEPPFPSETCRGNKTVLGAERRLKKGKAGEGSGQQG